MPDAAFHLPAGITEADLIDLVDGVTLHPSREAAVLAALKAEPRLGLLIKQLREDRGGLGALGEVHAPLGLAEGIEARLEADAIRSLAQAEDVPTDSIPISTIRVETPGIWQLLLESAWPRRLATAASLAIVGSLVYFGGREVVRAWPNVVGGSGGSTIVVNPVNPNPAPMPDVATTPNVPPIDVAAKTDPTPETPTVVAAHADVADHADIPLTPEQAAALAREGRLAISVRAPRDVAGTLKNVEALARNAGREATWRGMVPESVPTELAFLTAPTMPAPVVHPMPSRPTPDVPTVAAAGTGAHDAPAPSAVQHPTAQPAARRPVVKAIYTVKIDPRERAIAQLIESLRGAGSSESLAPGTEVVLRRLDQPIERPISLDPEDILWWANQPNAWTRRAMVPIVIETVE